MVLVRGSWRLGVAVALAFACVLALGAARADAMIIWQKGTDIWGMQDNLSSPGRVVKLADIPGATRLGRPNTTKSGRIIVFEAQTASSGNYATGIYKYYGNKITRLSPAAAACTTSSGGTCTRRHLDPEIAVAGSTTSVIFESTYISGTNLLSSQGNLQTVPIAGGVAPTNFGPQCSGALKFPSDPAANPADGAQIAYVGCRDGSDPPRYQLILSKASRAEEKVIASNADAIVDPSFATDGQKVVAVRRGDAADSSKAPGIWTHNTFQSSLTFNGSTIKYYGSKHLVKMTVGSADQMSPRFMGTDNSKVIFAYQGELWSVPAAGCGSSPCAFPSGATKLTTDGATTALADVAPTWTSATSLAVYTYVPRESYTGPTTNSSGDEAVSTTEEGGTQSESEAAQCPPDNPYDCDLGGGGLDNGGAPAEDLPPEEDLPPSEETPSDFEQFPTEEFGPGTDEFGSGSEEFPTEGGGENDTEAPELTAFKLSRKTFKPFTSRGSGGGKLGTIVSFRLSEASKVKFTLEKAAPGRLSERRSEIGTRTIKRCDKPTRANRKKKLCKRWLPKRGSFTLNGRTRNSFAFTGWWQGDPLPRGSYRLVVQAVDSAKNRSRRVLATFTLKR